MERGHMSWPYEANHYILWPVTVIVFFGVLGAFVWRQRKAPGAIPFLFIIACSMAWALSNSFVRCAVNDETRLFWHQFQMGFPIPFVTAELCFGIGYAGLGRLLTRKRIALLAVVPVLYAVVLMTNKNHHLALTGMTYEDYTVHVIRGPATWAVMSYCYFLSFLNLVVLIRLFIRSPRHRWIVTGLMVAIICSRGVSILCIMGLTPLVPFNPRTIVSKINILCYAVAFFRFRMFEVVPVARDMVLERMRDAMIVLDIENRIADINVPARALFNMSRPRMVGKQIADVMHAHPDLLSLAGSSGPKQCDICFNEGNGRWFQVSVSPLMDRRGFKLGQILWFHDITEEREARLKILSQQQALAMLQEREFLARELHDGIGQMLAAVDMQASAAGTLLARKDLEGARSCLDSISATTRQGKAFIRDYLFGVKTGPTGEQGLIESLSRYISHYNREWA